MSQRKKHEKTHSGNHGKRTTTNQNELPESINNRYKIDVLGRCLPAGLQNVDFGDPEWIFRFSGVPLKAKIDKTRRKNCLTNRLKKTLCRAEFLSHKHHMRALRAYLFTDSKKAPPQEADAAVRSVLEIAVLNNQEAPPQKAERIQTATMCMNKEAQSDT